MIIPDIYLLIISASFVAAILVSFHFFRLSKREEVNHAQLVQKILGEKHIHSLDPSKEQDRWHMEAMLDLERNRWTKWSALASSIIATLLAFWSCGSFAYTERVHKLEIKENNTRAFYQRWNDTITPNSRKHLDSLIQKCKQYENQPSNSTLIDYVITNQTSSDSSTYEEYATVISILNLFEQIAESYNDNDCIRSDIEEQYSSSILLYYNSLEPFVNAYKVVDKKKKDITGEYPKHFAPWDEIENAALSWESIQANARRNQHQN
ncbi:MAG: hypothetical protein H7A35_13315 [Planctomycetales bacterium]|nr:MAG: hypothetical protein H7A35_13315 [Planctomycetales bacterium]